MSHDKAKFIQRTIDFIDSLEIKTDIFQTNHEFIYHYTDVNAIKNIIEKRELWLTKHDFLNDIHELRYTQNLVKELLDEFFAGRYSDIKELPADPQQVYLNYFNEKYEQFLNNYECCIGSFSVNSDSNLLWANYSNNDGYNIEFQVDNLREEIAKTSKNTNDFLFYIGEVIYDKEKQKELLDLEIKKFFKIVYGTMLLNKDEKSKIHMHENIDFPFLNIFLYSCLFKNPVFKQEDEVRIIILNSASKFSLETRTKQGAILPYLNIKLDDKAFNQLITSINIGPKNNLDIAELGLNYLLKVENLENVKVNKSAIPYRY